MSKPKYPTWKVQGHPTPAETLYVCPKCGNCEWSNAGLVRLCHNPDCKGRKGGPPRMRKGTAAETADAKKRLALII